MISSCRSAAAATQTWRRMARCSSTATVGTSSVRTYSSIAAAAAASSKSSGNTPPSTTTPPNTQQPQNPQIQRRSMKGGTRGARGHGWFLKYRQGLGGRHLQGKFYDRDIEFLEDWNDQIFEWGSTRAFLNVRVGAASNSPEKQHKTQNYTLHMDLATAALPETTQNFLQLAKDGYYDNTTFYRMESQTGLAAGDVQHLHGKGGHCHPDMGVYGVLLQESMVLRHTKGIVTMLCPGVDRVDSRFFCCTQDAPQLDGYHVPFAKLTPESLQICEDWQKNIYTKRGKPTVDMVITHMGLVGVDDEEGQVAASS